MFSTKGLNIPLFHWQADSSPLSHLGSPNSRIVDSWLNNIIFIHNPQKYFFWNWVILFRYSPSCPLILEPNTFHLSPVLGQFCIRLWSWADMQPHDHATCSKVPVPPTLPGRCLCLWPQGPYLTSSMLFGEVGSTLGHCFLLTSLVCGQLWLLEPPSHCGYCTKWAIPWR